MYCIGFDVGGTKCAVSLGLCEGEEIRILGRRETPTKKSPYETLEELSSEVVAWTEKFGVKRAGISCGGPLDAKRGVILSTPNLSEEWHGFDIVKYIGERFSLSARLENDANASALAEWKFGAGRGLKNVIYLTFGTGLGAGLILDGKLYAGTNGNAGEVGHIRLEKEGPVGYRKEGSAEGFCSGKGISRLAYLRAAEKGIPPEEGITAKTVFARARQGDGFCLSVVRESAEKFASVLAVLIDLFNPEAIIAGGVFMRNHDLLMPWIEPVLREESLEDSRKVCRILPAAIGENVGDYAALSAALQEEGR